MYSEKPKLHERQKNYKQGNLRTLSIDVTPKCNMNCPHCYEEPFFGVEPVELDVLNRALDEAYNMGVYHYILQGGEPIVDMGRLISIISMCHSDESYINVVTNGWEMAKETIHTLKDIEVDKIAFSLDSGLESEHDANRREGSYKRVLEGIGYTLRAGLDVSISLLVTHQSLHSRGFNKALELARRKGIRVDLQIAEPVGKWDGETHYLMTPEDSAYIKQLESSVYVSVKRDIFNFPKDHCPAGIEFLSIAPDGQILPCIFLQFSLGNIRNKSLTEMRNDLMTSNWFVGKCSMCLCGENQTFIDKYILPYIGQPKPLDAYKVFGLRRIKE